MSLRLPSESTLELQQLKSLNCSFTQFIVVADMQSSCKLYVCAFGFSCCVGSSEIRSKPSLYTRGHLLTQTLRGRQLSLRREDHVAHFGNLLVGLLVLLRLVVVHLTLRIYYENLAQRNSYIAVADCIGLSVPKASIERIESMRKELPNIAKTSNLEHLGFLQYNFTAKRTQKTIRRHYYGSGRQLEIFLLQTLDVLFSCFGLPDCACCQVEYLIAVVVYSLK